MFKKKILVIDDTELMVRIIRDILEAADYYVITSNNALEGINKVALEKPDLVLLDVVMPGMTGFEACKILRDDEGNNLMPIIILTSQDNEEDKLTGLELGADDYIIKPFNPRELLSRVNNTIKRIERNRRANPLTGLQGNIEIQSELHRKITNGLQFSVIYGDIDNFKAYNDVYGFTWGDRAIKLTADILIENVHLFGSNMDFVGHIGGDDFVIVTLPTCAESICKGIIQDFDEKIKNMYSCEDRSKGFITTENRQGATINYSLMSISLVIVSNEGRKLVNQIEISDIIAELKKKAKSIQGSVYVKDMRLK